MQIKIKTALLTIITVTLLLFFCVSVTVETYAASAETGQTEVVLPESETEPATPETTDGEEVAAPDINELADKFKSYLVGKFGDDYEYYYNQIIERWGSIEGYLLAFGEKLPEEQRTGWDKFVDWLGRYAPVWAPVLAVIIVIVIAAVGKKVFNNAIERIVNVKLKPVVQELNLQSNATTAIIHSQKALLGTSDKFAENVKELEEADRGLNNG